MKSPGFVQAFLSHLDELRSRVLKSLGVFFIVGLFCFNCADRVLAWALKPAGHLVFTTPGGGFSAVMTATLVMAALISSPYILYQLWAFVAAGLKPHERKFVYVFGPLSLVFFCLGVSFAFFVAVPTAYKFLMGFSSSYLTPMITVDNYLSFVGSMALAFGVTFELPLILAFLASIGIATPEFLRQKRRHAIMIILIVAAIVTPPDVASQLLLAIPLIVLYEIGIIFVQMVYKHKTL